MAVGEARGDDPPDRGNGSSSEAHGFQWTLTLLPAFPILLLVLRLWHLSKQDLHTMLLLVQNVGPLDLVSSLVITLMWVPPVFLLAGQALGLLYLVSTPDQPRRRSSWLAKTATRTPDWAVAVTVMWAATSWQLRFLPALAMVTVVIVGLTTRLRNPDRPRLIWAVCVGLPVAIALFEYGWLLPAIGDAFSRGEAVLAMMLLVPPALAPLLTGPIPARFARVSTHAPAAAGALLAPFLLVAVFLRAPVLPTVAMELEHAPDQQAEVVLGSVVTVDDTMTTLLDDDGAVRFVPNARVASKVLCPGAEAIPNSAVEVHQWSIERSALQWLLPAKETRRPKDPRCDGRPLVP
jgi:hypothetical protein